MRKPLEPAFSLKVPAGEDRERRVCDHCGFIDYVNPKIVVGAVAVWSATGAPFGPRAVGLEEVRFLLCRRAILPRRGYWTLPAGYLEEGETVAEGTLREAAEEAGAALEIDGVLALYDIPRRSQVQVIHRARLKSPELDPGAETIEARLFAWDAIPWKALAFHSVSWALLAFEETRRLARFPPHSNPPGEPGWLGPAGL
jgi:ADP-ribose pyrophosphatase YjhB (NUDIX family)